MKKNHFLPLIILVLFISCGTYPNKEDFIGIWTSKDGARLQFNNDNTFYVKNIPRSILFGNYSSKKIFSGSGTWDIICMENIWRIELIFPKCEELPSGFACYINISSKHKFNETASSLFFYGENFDYKYEFQKLILTK